MVFTKRHNHNALYISLPTWLRRKWLDCGTNNSTVKIIKSSTTSLIIIHLRGTPGATNIHHPWNEDGWSRFEIGCLKNLFSIWISCIPPIHSYVCVSYLRTWMELIWKRKTDTSAWLATHNICLKLRSKSDKEILKVSNLITNPFHYMLSNLPVKKSSCLWKISYLTGLLMGLLWFHKEVTILIIK